MLGHPPRPGYFLERWGDLLQAGGRTLNGIGIAYRDPCGGGRHLWILVRAAQSLGIAEVPCLKLPTRDADQRIAPSRLLTHLDQPRLEGHAIAGIIVAHHDEAVTRYVPRPQLSRNALLQILFALVRARKESRAPGASRGSSPSSSTFIDHSSSRNTTDSSRAGPSNSPCFHSAPGKSHLRPEPASSLALRARWTSVNPALLTSQ